MPPSPAFVRWSQADQEFRVILCYTGRISYWNCDFWWAIYTALFDEYLLCARQGHRLLCSFWGYQERFPLPRDNTPTPMHRLPVNTVNGMPKGFMEKSGQGCLGPVNVLVLWRNDIKYSYNFFLNWHIHFICKILILENTSVRLSWRWRQYTIQLYFQSHD